MHCNLPSKGPVTVPRDHIAPSELNHFPRSFRGILSTTIKAVMHRIPPPPAPWMVLPTSTTVKFVAIAMTIEPTKKRVMLTLISGFLPKTFENDPNIG